ncbi:universal stress protein [Chloroflexota bacterium]
MYKQMLVPLDGSRLAENALIYGVQVATKLNLDITLLHVYKPDELEFVPSRQSYIERAVDLVQNQLEEIQKDAGAQMKSRSLEVQCKLAKGHPAEQILGYAEENQIDLILIGTHGRSGISRWAMGSVADKVLRGSSVPIWLVRAGLPKDLFGDKRPVKSILVPLDGSELAESVLPHVEVLAKQRDTEQVDVVLLSVCKIPLVADYYLSYIPLNWDDHARRCRREAEGYLAIIERRLKDSGLKVRSEVVVAYPQEAGPADKIVDYSNSILCDLIVMSTHGHSGLIRWAFGSVADRVLHGASRPILLVRSTVTAAEAHVSTQATQASTAIHAG